MTAPMTQYQEAQYLEGKVETLMANLAPRKVTPPPSVERAFAHLSRVLVAGVEVHSSDLALVSLSLMVVDEWFNGGA